MNNYRLLLFLISINSANVFADGAYRQYLCNNANDMNACSSNCPEQIYTLDFKVNPSNSTVIQIFYNNGTQTSTALENCKVVDADNWTCISTTNIGNNYIMHSTKLGGGIYTSSLSSNIISNSYNCAKKRFLFGIFD